MTLSLFVCILDYYAMGRLIWQQHGWIYVTMRNLLRNGAQKKANTIVFNLLVFLEKQQRESHGNVDLIGSCKLPRFQYANYTSKSMYNFAPRKLLLRTFLIFFFVHP